MKRYHLMAWLRNCIGSKPPTVGAAQSNPRVSRQSLLGAVESLGDVFIAFLTVEQERRNGHGQCELHAESDEAVGAAELTNIGAAEEAAVISTEITHTFAATGEVTMTCQVNSIPWALGSGGTRIVAIRVDTQHKTTASTTE